MTHLLIQADARRIPLPDRSVHCVVTSPPYWGLRDYSCNGQIGLEPTPEAYVASMVAVFREVWRVLRPDGCAWVNLGDSYAAGKPKLINSNGWDDPGWMNTQSRNAREIGLKPKDLVGIPWRVALALQADGWFLRSDIIWAKPNPMPESVTDRPTKSHEYLFLLTKQERYYFDQEAVRENWADEREGAPGGKRPAERNRGGRTDGYTTPPLTWVHPEGRTGRNLRSVWTIPTESYAGAHFATFPRKLVEPCIKAGTSERGACPSCGAPWERVTESPFLGDGNPNGYGERLIKGNKMRMSGEQLAAWKSANPSKPLGFRPTCSCPTAEPVPCRVLDPFAGSGTTLVVAEALGRIGIGLDLSADYLAQARRRIERPHQPLPKQHEQAMPLFAQMEVGDSTPSCLQHP